MRRLAGTAALVVIATLAIAAQQRSAEDAAVRKTIEDHYFKAHSTGDGALLKGTFVDEGRMMWVQDGHCGCGRARSTLVGSAGSRRRTKQSASGAS
jgi:hypothetical protein